MKFIHSHFSIPRNLNTKGFSLVELMMALAISLIIGTTIVTAYISQRRTAYAQEQIVEMQQDIRTGLDIMEREIRMAGYNPRRTAVGTGITTATATKLVFAFVADTDQMDNNNNGTIDEPDEVETVEYSLYDAYGDVDTDLGRRTPVAINAVAENIDAIEFYYTMQDGTRTLTPAILSDIRAIQISILARASKQDSHFTNSTKYTPGSGNATWGLYGGANPPNDHFRRHLLITTVQCRNMGLL